MCLSLLFCVLCKNRAMKVVTLLKYSGSQGHLGITAVTLLLPLYSGELLSYSPFVGPGVEQWGEVCVASPQQDPAAWQWYLTVRGYGETDKDGGELGSAVFPAVPCLLRCTWIPLPLWSQAGCPVNSFSSRLLSLNTLFKCCCFPCTSAQHKLPVYVLLFPLLHSLFSSRIVPVLEELTAALCSYQAAGLLASLLKEETGL